MWAVKLVRWATVTCCSKKVWSFADEYWDEIVEWCSNFSLVDLKKNTFQFLSICPR
jgi:hypothetical protein